MNWCDELVRKIMQPVYENPSDYTHDAKLIGIERVLLLMDRSHLPDGINLVQVGPHAVEMRIFNRTVQIPDRFLGITLPYGTREAGEIPVYFITRILRNALYTWRDMMIINELQSAYTEKVRQNEYQMDGMGMGA